LKHNRFLRRKTGLQIFENELLKVKVLHKKLNRNPRLMFVETKPEK